MQYKAYSQLLYAAHQQNDWILLPLPTSFYKITVSDGVFTILSFIYSKSIFIGKNENLNINVIIVDSIVAVLHSVRMEYLLQPLSILLSHLHHHKSVSHDFADLLFYGQKKW